MKRCGCMFDFNYFPFRVFALFASILFVSSQFIPDFSLTVYLNLFTLIRKNYKYKHSDTFQIFFFAIIFAKTTNLNYLTVHARGREFSPKLSLTETTFAARRYEKLHVRKNPREIRPASVSSRAVQPLFLLLVSLFSCCRRRLYLFRSPKSCFLSAKNTLLCMFTECLKRYEKIYNTELVLVLGLPLRN